MRPLAIVLFAASLVPSFALAQKPPTLRLPDGARPMHYAFELTVDPTQDRLTGAGDIDVEITKPLTTLWLNADELTVTKATIAGKPARVVTTPKDFVGLEALLQPGKVRVHLEWSAPITTKDSAGAFREKEGDDWYAFTQFEPIDARRVFPSFDEPSFKVPWQLTLRVPAGDGAFSNTMPTQEKADGAWKVVRFAETKPLPSYLIAFAVGPFEVVDGGMTKKSHVPVRIITPKGEKDRARWAAQVSHTILERLEDYFDIEYPFGKLDCIAIPLSGFGAMENPGLITFSSRLLLQKPSEETVEGRRDYADVAAHEFAHQWTGDLVTTAWWDDLWLNEAFATWMEAKLIEEWQPTWGAAEERIGTRRRAMQADSLVSARRIRQPIVDDGDMKTAFDRITYNKGATVIGTFERYLGPEVFRRGVQRYLRVHAFKNGTASSFLASISLEAGHDIAPAFSSFLDQAGVPAVSMDLVCDKTPHLHLKQERFLPRGSTGDAQKQLWQIPVCVRTDQSHSCTLLTAREADLPLGKCPAWVMPNDGGAAYYRARPSADLLKRLDEAALPSLSAPEKLSLLSDLNAMVAAGKLDLDSVFELAPKLAADKNRWVVQAAADAIDLRDDDLLTPAERPAYARFVQKLFGARAHALGWKAKKSDDEDTRLLRAQLVPLVADAGQDRALQAEAQKLASAYLRDKKSVDADIVDEVLEVAARHGNRALWTKMEAAARKEKDRHDRQRLLGALSHFVEPKLVEQGLGLLLENDLDPRETMPLLRGAAQQPETRLQAWSWLQAHFDALAARLPRDSGGRLALLTSSLCDEADVAPVKAFFAPRAPKFDGGPRELSQALEQLHLCAAWRTAEAPVMARFFASHR